MPLAAGAFVGGAGVVIYLWNYRPSGEEEVAAWPRRRQLALKIVAGVDLALACLLLVVALAAGGSGFVLTAGLLVAFAAGALLVVWYGSTVDDYDGPGDLDSGSKSLDESQNAEK
jgi:hypothetical protein